MPWTFYDRAEYSELLSDLQNIMLDQTMSEYMEIVTRNSAFLSENRHYRNIVKTLKEQMFYIFFEPDKWTGIHAFREIRKALPQ